MTARYVSICAFARALLGRRTAGRMIAVFSELSAYFDDSGTHDTSPVVVLGGLLGTEEQWIAFEKAWGALLEHPLPNKPKLSQFHLSPCRAGDGEFSTYNRAERDRITYLFRQIILDTGLVTLAVAMNKIAWNELVVGDLVDGIGKPLAYCFVKCVDQVLSTIRMRKPGHKVVIAFDQGTKAELENWAGFYLAQSDKYPEIGGLGFGKVAEILPLQGADMIATESYQYAQEWLKNGENAIANAHFKDYLKRELSWGIVADREHIQEMISRVRERTPLSG